MKATEFSWEEVLTVGRYNTDNYCLIENLQNKNSSDTAAEDSLLLFSLLLTISAIRKQAVENESFSSFLTFLSDVDLEGADLYSQGRNYIC